MNWVQRLTSPTLTAWIQTTWRLVSAFLPGGHDAKAMVHRIGYIVSAIVYATFGFSAIALTRRSPQSVNGNSKVVDISASMMKHGAGRWAIGAAGLAPGLVPLPQEADDARPLRRCRVPPLDSDRGGDAIRGFQ